MARTRAEIEKQIAELEDELNSSYDEDETLCVELPNGNKVYLKGDKVKTYLRKHGLEEDEVEIEEVEEEKIEKPVAKKTAAKKVAAPRIKPVKPKEEVIPTDDELEEELHGEPEKPSSFFGRDR